MVVQTDYWQPQFVLTLVTAELRGCNFIQNNRESHRISMKEKPNIDFELEEKVG
jgi:hypothetical protein